MRVIPGKYFSPAAITAFIISWPALGAEAQPIPDFSGLWGRDWPFFEQPRSGPGPIVSALRNHDGTFSTDAFVGDLANPMLKPHAAEFLMKRGAISLNGAASPDPVNQCWPEPVPFTLGVQFGMQMLQHKDGVTIIYIGDHKVRHVRLNEPHPANVTPSWQGHSVGHYEGDTLVIDTVGQKVGPLSVFDLFGTPFSPALHVIERYRLIDAEATREAVRKREAAYLPPGTPSFIRNTYGRGPIDTDPMKKGLQVEIMVEDPGVFNTPWSGFVTYQHVTGLWPEMVCAEAPFLGVSSRIEMPRAERLDF